MSPDGAAAAAREGVDTEPTPSGRRPRRTKEIRTMFTGTMVKALTATAGATLLAGTMLFASPTAPAAAAGLNDAWLSCGTGTETIHFGLPLAGTRYSQFAYRLDGGAWQYTNWYYASNSSYQVYTNAGWQGIRDGGGPIIIVGGGHLVEGWEYRWTPASGAQWVNLGSCTTSSFFSGGIVYT
jgi:hypothetical protein